MKFKKIEAVGQGRGNHIAKSKKCNTKYTVIKTVFGEYGL